MDKDHDAVIMGDDLDRLGRDQVRELGGAAAALVDVLDDWLLREHGLTSGWHHVGSFLHLLAAEGYCVVPTASAS